MKETIALAYRQRHGGISGSISSVWRSAQRNGESCSNNGGKYQLISGGENSVMAIGAASAKWWQYQSSLISV
jgi:predicted Rossmann-fold nucleotide-binding protein